MAELKEITKSDIAGFYKAGVKVYLESEDDLYILSRIWFSEFNDKLSFEAVCSEGGADGGCFQVIKRVNDSLNRGVLTFGIVDRDVLMSDDEHRKRFWWETDDHKFLSNSPYGENIHVLKRWEIENYLLKPLAIQKYVHTILLVKSPPDINAKTFLNHEEDLINLTSLSTLAMEFKRSNPKHQFGRGLSGSKLKHEILSHLDIDDSQLSKHRQKISAFTNDIKESEERWDKITRMLDGKRALYYLTDRIRELEPKKLKKMCLMTNKGQIAIHIANLKLIDYELLDITGRYYNGALAA